MVERPDPSAVVGAALVWGRSQGFRSGPSAGAAGMSPLGQKRLSCGVQRAWGELELT